MNPGELLEPPPAELLPVRMLVEFAYCPRLFHLMHVQGRWTDNAFTEDGRNVHQRVDGEEDLLPVPAGDPGDAAPAVGRSISLSSQHWALTGKMDLVETDGDEAVPVEYKRGQVPDNPERSWEPERVQLMAQGLLLREAGYRCERGILYFAASRTRIEIALDSSLRARTLDLLAQAQAITERIEEPPPLDHSRKCQGCSLAGICLPDETHLLLGTGADEETGVRRLYPPRDDAQPLYVQEQGAMLGKTGDNLKVTKAKATLLEAHLIDVSQVVLCGSVQITASALHLCAESGIPVVHLSMGHWFYGITQGMGLRNAYDRAAQFRQAASPDFCLKLAQAIVAAKGQNQRTLLRRNGRDLAEGTLEDMAHLLRQVDHTANLAELLGIEGLIARSYFGQFPQLLRPRNPDEFPFDMDGRNRRPPKDPVNACLSFLYALLVKECTVALLSVGLDPHWGFFHQPRHGRPALALDLMEEFRAVVVDSAVINAINTGMLAGNDFETNGVAWSLKAGGRKSLIKAFELRLDQLITHPVFDYKISWRRVIFVQAQLLARVLRGELPAYPGIVTR
jgi:CRISPR-associated protein Cas1